MKKAEYKVVTSTTGLPDLEKAVTKLLNEGWKPLGGIAFNQGYPYQAVARFVQVKPSTKPENAVEKSQPLTANQAMAVLDEIM